MATSSGSARRRGDGGGILEEGWVWIALPVGVLALIAALWFLVIAPGGKAPPRATVTPAQSAAQPTVTIMVIAAPTQAPESATPTPARPTTVAVGARVVVVTTGGSRLNLRQEPGTGSVSLKLLPAGTQLVVVGGPQEASGHTWWKVEDPTGMTGWAAADYIELAP